MSSDNELFNIFSAHNQKNAFQLYEKKLNKTSYWLISKKYPDFNFVLHSKKQGFSVEFYNSTFDFVSHTPIQMEELNQGLSLFLSGSYELDDTNICKLFHWNL